MTIGKEIKRRIKSINNTSKITKAMELISTVKMKKAQDLAVKKKEYIKGVLEAFMNINQSLSETVFFGNKSNSGKTLGVIITSNKGLCGGYNVNVMKKVNSYMKNNPCEIDFCALGKRGSQFIARTGNNIIADFSESFTDNINLAGSKAASRFIIEKYVSGKYDKVVIFYNYYFNTIKQIPISRDFLPLTDAGIEKYFRTILGDEYNYTRDDKKLIYKIEPSIEELINEVIPMLIDAMFYDILIESKASEHSSRMIAMKNSKDNANKYASKLLLKYNKARQATITTEISEIVSGVESMKD